MEGCSRRSYTELGWGCFFPAVSGAGLFLCSSSGVGLFCSAHQKWGGVVLQWFQRWDSNNFVSSHSSVMSILYAADTGV